jgi:hypothetical protein
MAVVVEQTIPFSTPSLDLQNTNRWNGLLPLVRRSVKQVQTSKGQQLLINQSIIDSKFCSTVAVTTPGNFSSKLLDGSRVAAIVTEEPGKEGLTARDIKHALQEFGATEHQALVVVRSGKRRNLKASVEDNSIDVEVNGELEYDHLLFVLANRSKGSRRMIEDADGLVKDFFKNALTAYSTFHTDKVEGKPAISSAGGDSAAFKSVKSTVEKQLKSLFETRKDQSGKVTYSIHYSDINGLSRLENYIIAKEIAEYCRMYHEPTSESPTTDQQNQTPKKSPSNYPTPQSSTTQNPAAASQSLSTQLHHTNFRPRRSLKQTPQPPTLTALPSPKPYRLPLHKSSSTTPRSASASTPAATPSSKKSPQSQSTTRSSEMVTAGTRSATAQNRSWRSSRAKISRGCRRPSLTSCAISKLTWAAHRVHCIAFSSQRWRLRWRARLVWRKRCRLLWSSCASILVPGLEIGR